MDWTGADMSVAALVVVPVFVGEALVRIALHSGQGLPPLVVLLFA